MSARNEPDALTPEEWWNRTQREAWMRTHKEARPMPESLDAHFQAVKEERQRIAVDYVQRIGAMVGLPRNIVILRMTFKYDDGSELTLEISGGESHA
jgi:hypothetical protein